MKLLILDGSYISRDFHVILSIFRNFVAVSFLVLPGFSLDFFLRGIAYRLRLLTQTSFSRKYAEFRAKVCVISIIMFKGSPNT